MNRRFEYWFLYPMIGPVLGLILFLVVLSFGGEIRIPSLGFIFKHLMRVEYYFLAYLYGGLQAFFVGICDGVYAWKFKAVPVWLPLSSALFAFTAFMLFTGWVETLAERSVPLGYILIDISPVLLMHLLPAVAIWYLIKIVYRPSKNV